mgnify:CR=1 FL=1
MQKKDIFFEKRRLFLGKISISLFFTYFCSHEIDYKY